jgi:hypothetical protein
VGNPDCNPLAKTGINACLLEKMEPHPVGDCPRRGALASNDKHCGRVLVGGIEWNIDQGSESICPTGAIGLHMSMNQQGCTIADRAVHFCELGIIVEVFIAYRVLEFGNRSQPVQGS